MSALKVKSDPRRAQRLPIVLGVDLLWDGGALRGHSTDISATGLFLQPICTIPVGDTVTLAFRLPGSERCESVEVVAGVIRQVSPLEARNRGLVPGIGLDFQEFLLGEAALIRELSRRLDFGGNQTSDPEEELASMIERSLPVLWGGTGEPNLLGDLMEIESQGAFLVTRRAEAAGTKITFSFSIPAGERNLAVQGAARARWSNTVAYHRNKEYPLGMKIEFQRLSVGKEHLLSRIDGYFDGFHEHGGVPARRMVLQAILEELTPTPGTFSPESVTGTVGRLLSLSFLPPKIFGMNAKGVFSAFVAVVILWILMLFTF